MGHYTSTGEYIPSKLEAVQMDKNRVRKRATQSERAMRRVRAIIEDPQYDSDTDIVEAIITAVEDWEDAMAGLEKCGAEHGEFHCTLPVGHKHRHVGYDGFNHRHDWSNTAEASDAGEAKGA